MNKAQQKAYSDLLDFKDRLENNQDSREEKIMLLDAFWKGYKKHFTDVSDYLETIVLEIKKTLK